MLRVSGPAVREGNIFSRSVKRQNIVMGVVRVELVVPDLHPWNKKAGLLWRALAERLNVARLVSKGGMLREPTKAP